MEKKTKKVFIYIDHTEDPDVIRKCLIDPDENSMREALEELAGDEADSAFEDVIEYGHYTSDSMKFSVFLTEEK